MPLVEKQDRKQKAVYWQFDSLDDYGQIKVKDPVEIEVRWEQTISQQIGPQGSPVAIDGTVFVNQDITERSILWQGTLKNVPASFDGELFEVISFNKVPDIKGRKFHRSVGIRKYTDSLPTVV